MTIAGPILGVVACLATEETALGTNVTFQGWRELARSIAKRDLKLVADQNLFERIHNGLLQELIILSVSPPLLSQAGVPKMDGG
jgi:hypothetical protein